MDFGPDKERKLIEKAWNNTKKCRCRHFAWLL